mmetsp:Transcript_8774/g.17659  ORF Transcript_8774/g.17659 Transcript_8774/m.17659 type:complete len:563 (-) Transcript_8774:535-2223(-)
MDQPSPLGAEKDGDDEQSESHVSFPPRRNNFESAQASSSLSPALSSILTRSGIQQNQNTNYPSTTIMPWAWNALIQASKQNFTASQQAHYEQGQHHGHPIRTTTTIFTQPLGTAMPSPFNFNLSKLSSPRAHGQPNSRTWTGLPAQHPQQLPPQPSSQYPQSQQQMKQNQIQMLQNLNELSQLFQSRNSDLSQFLQQNQKLQVRSSSTSPNSAIAVLPNPDAPAPLEANLFQFSANLIAAIQSPNHPLFQRLPAMLETMRFATISGEPRQDQPQMDADAKSAAADTENIETTSLESDGNWGSSPHDRIPKNCKESGNQRKQHSSPLESNCEETMKLQKRISQKDYYKDPAADEHGRVLKMRKHENHETNTTSQQASNRCIGLTTQYQEKFVESRSEDVGNAASVATANPESQRHPGNNDQDTSAWHTENNGNNLHPHAKEFLSLSPTTSVSSINEAILQSNYCPATNRKRNPTIEVVSYFVSQSMSRRKKRKPFKNVNRIPLANRQWHDAQNHKMIRRSMVAIMYECCVIIISDFLTSCQFESLLFFYIFLDGGTERDAFAN